MNDDKKYSYLINNNMGSEEVINAIINIYGLNDDSIDNIIYYYTGYNNFEQYLENEDYNTYCEHYIYI